MFAHSGAIDGANNAFPRRARGGDPKGPEKWSSYLSQDPMWTDVGSEEIFIPIGPWLPSRVVISPPS